MATTVSTEAVIGFRLAAHHLTQRVGPGQLTEAAGQCGVQDSPPGSAALALHARVDGVTPDGLTAALDEDATLLRTWSLRGAPFVLPTADAAVFTTGVLPPTEGGRRHLVLGVEQSLDALGMSLDEVVGLARDEIGTVLSGQRLAITELGALLAERIAPRLSRKQRTTWQHEGPHAKGQPVGEAVVHFCVRLLTLEQVLCFAPRSGRSAPFVLVDEWLDEGMPQLDPQVARAELMRRYLRSYGPSTRGELASWIGVRSGDADPWWDLVEDELTEVDIGRRAWILTDDLAALQAPPQAKGVRLLPPGDPYTQMRDRSTIVDREHQRAVWSTVGSPGAVLVDGTIVGAWRPRKQGRRLTMTITPFATLRARDRRALEEEAEQIAPLRGASSADVVVETD